MMLPQCVYAYSKLWYYDFAYIMDNKGYSVLLDLFQVIAVDKTSNEDDIESKYYYYNFFSEDDSKYEINYLLNELKQNYNVSEVLHELDDSSYFEGNWNDGTSNMYKYCFRYVGNIVCGVGDVKNKDKIKNNVDDLFRDDLSEVYSLDKVHDKIKDLEFDDLKGVLNKIGVFDSDESISSDDSVSMSDSNKSVSSVIYLGIGIIAISVLFWIIGMLLLKAG